MDVPNSQTDDQKLTQRLAGSGFRFTPQRQEVYNVLLQQRDHPTAEEVFMRAKRDTPDISLATVYNCLDALVTCGLIKQVNVSKGAGRYCPNMREHHHFHCDKCGRIQDLEETTAGQPNPVSIPAGFQVSRYEIAVHGLCPQCAANSRAQN